MVEGGREGGREGGGAVLHWMRACVQSVVSQSVGQTDEQGRRASRQINARNSEQAAGDRHWG